MTQKGNLKKRSKQSKGSSRKVIGTTQKFKGTRALGKNKLRDKATSQYINMVEESMASRVPSDQRDKLTVVRSSGPATKEKNKKKPLTRGRKRKQK